MRYVCNVQRDQEQCPLPLPTCNFDEVGKRTPKRSTTDEVLTENEGTQEVLPLPEMLTKGVER